MALNPLISLQAETPDIGQTFSNVLLNVNRFDAIQRAREEAKRKADILSKQEEIKNILGQVGQPEQMPAGQEGPPQMLNQQDLIDQAKRIDPEFANQQLNAMGLDDASKRAEASRFAAEIQSLPQDVQNQRINERIDKLRNEGRNPSDTAQLLEMNPEDRAKALQGVQMLDLSTKERLSLEQKKAETIPKNKQVKSSDILPDGTTIQVMADGSTRVTDPEGSALVGKARTKAIRDAQEFGVNIQQRRSQARGIGKFTAKKAEEVNDRAEKMRENNDNLRQVIAEVQAGAETGPLVRMLPSLRASSVRLDNLKNRLGLDVIGSVTFGALSEGELRLAMDTALPTNLKGKDLAKWAEDKIDAQEKLAGYLEEQAAFLSQPGNTPAEWRMEVNRRKQEMANKKLPMTNAKGWRLMTDANGNKAYVGPNGEIEEVR